MNVSRIESVDAAGRISGWVTRLRLSEVPRTVLAVARVCIADGLGVMLAGSRSPVFGQCANLPRPAGDCAIVDGSGSTDASTAALLNGVACHALDFDDTCYAGIVHGTAVVLPAVMAAAQEVDADGRRLLEAFVAGVETEYALGLAMTDSLYERGFWATGTLGVIGAAAGAAKLLNLESGAVAEAVRLAANMPVGLRATHGSTGKAYLCGMAAKLGVEAAHAARAGIRGRSGTLERRHGFASTLNGGLLQQPALDALGRRYALVDPGIAFKLHPMCSAAQAAVEATITLRAQYGFHASDVYSVVCRATPLVVACLPYHLPAQPGEAQFSMPFAIACALLHGEVRLSHLDEDTLSAPALRQLMARIELFEDAALVAPEDAQGCPEAARVEIILRNGRCLQHTVLAATGMPRRPATEQQLRGKFMDCAMRATGVREAHDLWDRTRHIEDVRRARDLFDCLAVTGSV